MIWLALLFLTIQDSQPLRHPVVGNHHVSLAWQASTTPNSEYFVFRRTGSGPYQQLNSVPLVDLTFTDTTVSGHQTYSYYITAELNGVQSVPSNTVSVRIK